MTITDLYDVGRDHNIRLWVSKSKFGVSKTEFGVSKSELGESKSELWESKSDPLGVQNR